MDKILIDNELFSINLRLGCPAPTLQYCTLKRAFTLGELADLMLKGVDGLDSYVVSCGTFIGKKDLITNSYGKLYIDGEYYNHSMLKPVDRIYVTADIARMVMFTAIT